MIAGANIMKSLFRLFLATSFLALLFAPCSFAETDWQKILAEGEHELAVGNTNHALTIFLQKVKKYPSSAACHTALGRAYKRAGAFDQAREEFIHATQMEADFPDAFYELGAIEEYDKHWQEAAAAFAKYLALRPAAGERLAIADRIRFCQDHFSEVPNYSSTYSSVDQKKTPSADVKPVDGTLDKLTVGNVALTNPPKADLPVHQSVAKAVKSDKNNQSTNTNLCMAYAQSGQYDKAIEEFSKTIALDSNNPVLYNDRSVVYMKLKKYPEAIEDCSKAISLRPDYALAYRNRAIAYGNIGQHEKEVEDYTKAITLKPKESSYYRGRGTAFAKSRQCQKAVDDYAKAIDLNPKDADTYCNRGAVYIMLGQYEKSIADLSKAIEINPKLLDAYHMRAEAYDKLGQHDLAERDCQKEKAANQ
jgi:tetratricopeptide (TPR) repeat protein